MNTSDSIIAISTSRSFRGIVTDAPTKEGHLRTARTLDQRDAEILLREERDDGNFVIDQTLYNSHEEIRVA